MAAQGEEIMVIADRRMAFDVVVVGGGIAGLCAAVAAARNGARTGLIQDRPMLGGNASSEIRMWIYNARGENRKETGLLEELQLDNIFYNPEMKYTLWDYAMYSFAKAEKNLTLLLNTTVETCTVSGNAIQEICGWNLMEYVRYHIAGKIFIDCSGDGILRLSGAAARRGREAKNEFGESYAPDAADGCTLSSSIVMQLRRKDGDDRPFRIPDWAYVFHDEDIPPRSWHPEGNNFWWVSFGGVRDTLHDAEEIREELFKIAYGAWGYIKNHPDGRGKGWTLDWIGSLPGKRESWRFEGDHILTQNDIEAGGVFPDTVAHGGWNMDEHMPEAFYFKGKPSILHPTPSPFGIPYRSLYSRNIDNLLFAGRQISATHTAQSSIRVMGTCAVTGQAVGTAAALAIRYGISPREVGRSHLNELRETLLEDDQFIPGLRRTPAPLSLRGTPSHELLRDGMDRDWDDGPHGILLAPGEICGYTFREPVEISGVRIVFDSDLSDHKRLSCEEGRPAREMPGVLFRHFRVELQDLDGVWRTIHEETDNRHRLVRLHWNPVTACAVRIVPLEAWGGKSGRIFSLDTL